MVQFLIGIVAAINVTVCFGSNIKPDLSALTGNCSHRVQEYQLRNQQLQQQIHHCHHRLTEIEHARDETTSNYQASLISAEEQLKITLDSLSIVLDQQYDFLLSLRKLKKTGSLARVPLVRYLRDHLKITQSLISRIRSTQLNQNSRFTDSLEELIGHYHSSFSDFLFEPISKEFPNLD